MKYTEMPADLFSTDESYALAHCISEDCKMGAGIATQFVARFPKMRNKLLKKKPKTGQALPYIDPERVVFNLITKEKFWHKPTREAFNTTILSLRTAMDEEGIQKLAIPLLGAGLDRLDWVESKAFIQETFADTNVEIFVCIK